MDNSTLLIRVYLLKTHTNETSDFLATVASPWGYLGVGGSYSCNAAWCQVASSQPKSFSRCKLENMQTRNLIIEFQFLKLQNSKLKGHKHFFNKNNSQIIL
jgi:hypothetical protein